MRKTLDEIDRLLFIENNSIRLRYFVNKHKLIVFSFVCIVGLFVFSYWYSVFAYQDGYKKGLAEGEKTALNVRAPSEKLELACLGLWIGEQNKIYVERNK
jgi:hypothetical protein